MNLFLLATAGETIRELVFNLQRVISLAINITIGVTVALLIARWIIDAANINPFGRLFYYVRKPTNEMIYRARSSQFFLPLKRALGFDPAIIMILIALAILWMVANGIFGNLFTVMLGLGQSLDAFSFGQPFTGARYLIGTALLSVIFFLLALMTIIFVNWIFGFFNNAAYWAMNRIGPLLRIFEFGGVFAGWSFVILWIVLSWFAAPAVLYVFFQA
ncbi:MAG: hypothetical protein JMDDDDMK_04771 [Acidobacteria bacterium]|nr:hypothetical protein [Acidobacteriota bacterium]